jgi:hypothetical protein
MNGYMYRKRKYYRVIEIPTGIGVKANLSLLFGQCKAA